MAFILLPAENRVVLEAVHDNLSRVGTGDKIESLDSKLYDFDDVNYRLYIDFEDRSKLIVDLETQNWQACQAAGSEAWIREKLGNYVHEVTDKGVQFQLGLTDGDDYKADAMEIAENFARLRAYALGGPLNEYCKALAAGNSKTDPFDFALRNDTHMWIVPKGDRVVCVLGMEFPIQSDRIIANQILTEFVEVRRDRDVSSTPSISFSKNPPNELNGLNQPHFNEEALLGYFSILLLSSHVSGNKIENAVTQIVGFRSYLTYHIKCAKAYFHQRMRARVKTLLQSLNRARYEPPDQRKKKKLIVGADRR